MIQIIKENRKPSGSEKFNLGLQNAAQTGMQLAGQYAQEQQLRKENQKINQLTGLDLNDVRDPNTRQALIADQLTYGRKSRQAADSVNVNYGGSKSQDNYSKPNDRTASENNLDLKNDVLKNKETENRSYQSEVQGKKFQLFNPDQIEQEGDRISRESQKTANPISKDEGISKVLERERQKQMFNQQHDVDEARIKEQEVEYGQKSVEKLLKLMPDATDELQAIFRKKGEDAKKSNMSEADIDKELAIEAKKFKNITAKVKNSIPAPRLFENIKRGLLGTDRDFDKSRNDIRIKLKPLLDLGLYDTSRNILADLGYNIEEREGIISDLGENTKKVLNQLPDFKEKTKKAGFFESSKIERLPNGEKVIVPAGYELKDGKPVAKQLSENDLGEIKDNLRGVFKSDPATNLILLRKAYEDKGVSWSTFKDVLNDLIISGDVQLTEDQFNRLDSLETPPLDNLGKILHGLNLI